MDDAYHPMLIRGWLQGPSYGQVVGLLLHAWRRRLVLINYIWLHSFWTLLPIHLFFYRSIYLHCNALILEVGNHQFYLCADDSITGSMIEYIIAPITMLLITCKCGRWKRCIYAQTLRKLFISDQSKLAIERVITSNGSVFPWFNYFN